MRPRLAWEAAMRAGPPRAPVASSLSRRVTGGFPRNKSDATEIYKGITRTAATGTCSEDVAGIASAAIKPRAILAIP